MPDRVKINGVWYDANNAPPWYEHWIPGGLQHPDTLETARMNALRNLGGSDIGNVILWTIAGLFVVALIWFLAVL